MRRLPTIVFHFFLAFGGLVLSSAADAETILVAVNEENPTKHAMITEAAENALKQLEWTIPFAAKKRGEAADIFLQCGERKECRVGAVEGSGFNKILRITPIHEYESDGAARVIVKVSLIDGKNGEVTHSMQQFCARCNDQLLIGAVRSVVEKIHYESRTAEERESTKLTIVASPRNARITIEGPHNETVAPGTYVLKPGQYRVTAKADGYVSVTKSVAVTLGKTRQIHVELAADVKHERSSQLRYWKWAALGTGGAAILLGARWIVVDESKVQNGATQREHLDTKKRGIISIGIGTALVATGGLLWRLDRTLEQRPSSIRIGVLPNRNGGGFVTLGGGF